MMCEYTKNCICNYDKFWILIFKKNLLFSTIADRSLKNNERIYLGKL